MAEKMVRVFDMCLYEADKTVEPFTSAVRECIKTDHMRPVVATHSDWLFTTYGGRDVHVDWTRLVPESEVRRDG